MKPKHVGPAVFFHTAPVSKKFSAGYAGSGVPNSVAIEPRVGVAWDAWDVWEFSMSSRLARAHGRSRFLSNSESFAALITRRPLPPPTSAEILAWELGAVFGVFPERQRVMRADEGMARTANLFGPFTRKLYRNYW